MTKVGATLKRIRVEKNLTQGQVCKNVCTRTFLSKIENEWSIPNIVIMEKLLDNLDVTFDEFFFIVHNRSLTKDKNYICHAFFSLKDNYDNLEDILSLCDNYLIANSTPIIHDILTLSNHLIQIRNKTNLADDTASILTIWNRLEKINTYSLHEIKLMNTLLFLFPSDVALNLANILVKQIDQYQNFFNIESLKMAIYLNVSTIFLYEKKYVTSKKLIKKTILLSKKINRFDIYFYSLGRLALLDANEKTFKKSNDMLLSLDLYNYSNKLTIEQSFIKKNNDKNGI